MKRQRPTRRRVLQHLAAGVGLGLLPTACRRPDLSLMAAALIDIASDRATLATIGRAFLEEQPESLESILGRLAADLPWSGPLSAEELTARLARRIEHDFRHGATYRVDAWILSQTEARWSALVALSSD